MVDLWLVFRLMGGRLKVYQLTASPRKVYQSLGVQWKDDLSRADP